MVFVIARTHEHFRNWVGANRIPQRIVIPLLTSHDLHRIRGFRKVGYVKLTPMADPRDEERLMEVMRSKEFYELPCDINEWPVTEFPVVER